MTLDIPQFITNSIRTQSKIHHLDVNVKAVAKDDVPKSVTSLIFKDYGDKYLDDADYVAFFWGGLSKDNIDKLFNVVDKALGKSANKLTDKDFKKISMKADDSADDEDIEVDDDEEDKEDIEVDDEETEVVDDNDEDSDDSNEELDEDEDEEIEDAVEVEVEEKPKAPTAYFFLKITKK